MTLERQIRAIAGVFILASLALAHWCMMEDILRKLGTAPPPGRISQG